MEIGPLNSNLKHTIPLRKVRIMPDFSDILLTVDFDRTITAPDASIPERNLDAIRYFMAHGGAFTVNTGRSVPMYRRYMDIIPVNAPLLLYNGSAAYDTVKKEFTFCHLIDLDMTQTLRELMQGFPDMTVEIQGADAHYICRENQMWMAYNQANQCNAKIVPLGTDMGPFIKMCIYGTFHGPSVGLLFQATPEEMARHDEVERLVRQRYGDQMEIFRSGARIIDIHTKGVSKARSARALQKTLGKKILICIGDAENDVPMLLGADYAYCPADGVIANRFENVCHCAEGAVADVIYKKIPEIIVNHP